ncbi:MAG: choice-of-anchor A family protein [Phycisphaerales bacterium]|nr:choice-of-anchor A family protein [Phycisphaerales bacterium]MCB9863879.1 choice-of-anchor A family protein [Phycisphaerales bacterium]
MRNRMIPAFLAVLSYTTIANAAAINEWNLIVRNDLTTTSEVDGSALIGGSVMGTSNYSVQGVTASNGDGLAVGGNIAGGINIQINNGGNLRIAGSVLGGSNVNLNGGGIQINDANVPTTVANAFNELETLSNYLATLSGNGTLDGAGNMNAVPTLLDGQLVAVYNIMDSDLNGLGQLNLNFGSADSVIINVLADGAGHVDFVAPPNIIGGFNQSNSSKILWNLPDATSVTVNNSFNGALLAPFADLQLLGGGMNGSVAVNNVSAMNAEVRRFTYNGFTPEPSSLALLTLGGIAALRRRRAA